MTKTEKSRIIDELIKEKGGTRKDYENLMNQIAYHESAHTMDPTISQIGGGPGRGKYQFEAWATDKNTGKKMNVFYDREKNNVFVTTNALNLLRQFILQH